MKSRFSILFILIFQLFLGETEAQEPDRKLYVFTTATRYIDLFSRPMAGLGLEFKPTKRIGLSAEYNHRIANWRAEDSVVINSFGQGFSLELKFYYIKFLKVWQWNNYLALEYREVRDDYNSSFLYYSDTTSLNETMEHYGVLKNVQVFNLKYGLHVPYHDRLYFDPYVGLGLRYRRIVNVAREFSTDLGHELVGTENFWIVRDFEEFSGWMLNFSAGLKVGWRF